MTRLGVVLPPQDQNLSARDIVRLAELVEEGGYDAAFMPEAFSWDALCLLSGIAMATNRIQIGTSIVTIPVRTPAISAMASATIDDLSQGRHILGLGMGHRQLVTTWHGLPFEPRLQRLREYVEIVRRIHAGDAMKFEGRYYRSVDSQLGIEPFRRRIPIYLAALSLDTMRLAGEIADGLLPYYAPAEYLRRGIQAVREGSARVGRDPAEVSICLMIPTWVTDDPGPAREIARSQIAWYNNFEFYNRMFFAAGFEREAEQLRVAWERVHADPKTHAGWEESRDSDGADCGTAEFVTDAMVDSIFVIGDAQSCAERIESYRELGVDVPLIFAQGLYTTPEEAFKGFAKTFAALAPSARVAAG